MLTYKSVGIKSVCYLEGFLRPNETTSRQEIPRFLFVCNKNKEMFQSGFGYLTDYLQIV